MPGPPAPFVPTPLPNIGMSGDSPKDYSKQVTIEGQPVAIAGASFGSQGDIASKGTGGGIVSSNTHGPTKFIGPGSLDVKIEGKSVHSLGDPMLNNCGPSGSPANAATMTGVMQAPGVMAVIYGDDAPCPSCGKTHPIPAGSNVQAAMALVMKDLLTELSNQRQRIDRLAAATRELNEKISPYNRLMKNPKGHNPKQAADFARLSVDVPALQAELTALDAYFTASALLRLHPREKTYKIGYMFGVLICRCGAKKLFACSGGMTPGLAKIPGPHGLSVVGASSSSSSSFTPSDAQKAVLARIDKGVWDCAAPKLVDSAAGHQAVELSEQIFCPYGTGPTITFNCLELDGTLASRTQQFEMGETVPSCEKCQALLPEMVCKSKC